MGLSITNNVASLQGQHNLNKTNSAMGKSLERLSSGLKINRGADGPAGLVISEQQRAQIIGLQTAIENTSKAVNVVQTAEGGLNEINRLLGKVRGLALDSANAGVNDSNAVAANQAEIANALETIDRISNTTQFGTKKLLNGTAQQGALATSTSGVTTTGTLTDTTPNASSYTFTVSTAAQKATTTGAAGFAAAGGTIGASGGILIGGQSITLASSDTVDTAVTKINDTLSNNGINVQASNSGGQLKLTSTDFTTNFAVAAGSLALATVGLTAATNNHTDARITFTNSVGASIVTPAVTGTGNVVALTDELAGATVTLAADSSNPLATVAPANATFSVGEKLVFQIGANAGQTAELNINSVNTSALGVGAVAGTALSGINVTTAQGAQDAIAVIDKSINEITNLRGTLGAFQQNTLESTANNLRTTLENTVSAESTIRDTDFASETANFTKNQVLLQAGTSVLQNANQTAQLVLGLLRG